MNFPPLRFVAFPLAFATSSLISHAAEIYVAPSGNDTTGDGSIAAPYKTIQKAATLAVAGDAVFIRAGTYRETVTPSSSGIPGAPITFQNYPGETATISGADPLTGWTDLGNGVFRAPMPWNYNYELVSDSSFPSNQVFLDGKMLTLLRWPKETNLDPIGNPREALADASSVNGSNVILSDAEFAEPAARWVGAKVWVNLARRGLDGQGETGTVESTALGQLTLSSISLLTGTQAWGIGPGTRYYLFNPTAAGLAATGGPSAALAPGEWWLDTATQQLYVRTWDGQPPAETPGAPGTVEARRRSHAFSLDSRSWITVRGLRLFSTSIRTDNGSAYRTSTIAPANNILLDALDIRYANHFTDLSGNYQMQWIGKSGLILSGSAITLQNSTIHYSAGSAVSLLGQGNKVLNNVITDVNYSVSEAGAINTGKTYDTVAGNPPQLSLDHEIAYNTIYRTPQQGINFRALKNSANSTAVSLARIHHNVIHDVMLQSFDSAAIDTYGTNHQYVRVDHNHIFNIFNPTNFGIYFDFASAGVVDHNLVYEVRRPLNINWTNSASPQNMRVFNNTALTDGAGRALSTLGTTSPGSVIQNNLFSNELPAFPDAVVSHNLLTSPALFTASDQADYTLAAAASTAIDQGVSVSPFDDPIIGSAPDLGAFERGAAAWNAGSNLISRQPAPSALVATQLDSKTVRLDWLDHSDDETHFIVLRSPDDGVYWYEIGRVAANTTTFTDTQIPGGRYQYAVRGERSLVSARASARGGSAQTLFYAGSFDAQSGGIVIFGNNEMGNTTSNSWIRFNALDFGAAGSVTTFTANYASFKTTGQVQVWLDHPTAGTLIATLVAGTNDAVYRDVSGPVAATASGIHDVYLKFTEGGTANMRTFRFLGDAPTAPPTEPASLSCEWNGFGVQLAWSDLSSNEAEFRIERAIEDGPFTYLLRLPANTTSATDNNVASGVRYRYRVCAVNLFAPSAFSSPAEVTLGVIFPTWAVDASGDWSTATNWSIAPAPNGPDAIAVLGTGPDTVNPLRSINLNADVTLGSLTVDATLGLASAGYILSTTSGKSLIFDSTTGNATLTNPVASSSLRINTPIRLNDTLSVTAASTGDTGPTNTTASLFLNGTISGSGALLKSGSGNLRLSSTPGQSFSGGVTLMQGQLILGTPATGISLTALGTGPLTLSNAAAHQIDHNNFKYSLASPMTLANPATLDNPVVLQVAHASNSFANWSLSAFNQGALALRGSWTSTAPVTSDIALSAGGATGFVHLADRSGVTFSGNGKFWLKTGQHHVAGPHAFGANNSAPIRLGRDAGSDSITNEAALYLQGNQMLNSAISVNAAGSNSANRQRLGAILDGTHGSFTGPIQFTKETASRVVELWAGPNALVTLSGVLADTGTGITPNALVKQGAGTLRLTGNNSFDGTLTIANGGVLLDGDQSAATGTITLSGPLPGTTKTFVSGGANGTTSVVVSDTSGLAVGMAVSGTNLQPYTFVRGLSGSSTVQLTTPTIGQLSGPLTFGGLAGGTLGGLGTHGGGVTVSSGGTLAFHLGSLPANHDRLTLAGALSFSGPSTLAITADENATIGTYILLSSSGIAGPLPSLNLPANWQATLQQSGGDLQLIVTSIGLTALQTWRQTHFASIENMGTAADNYDYDADSLPNLLEYALGSDPLSANDVALPISGLNEAGHLEITFSRSRSDLTYEVQVSSDLVTWSLLSSNPGQVGAFVTVPDTLPLSETPRRFLRLRVVVP